VGRLRRVHHTTALQHVEFWRSILSQGLNVRLTEVSSGAGYDRRMLQRFQMISAAYQ
jgi:hypothetical protein